MAGALGCRDVRCRARRSVPGALGCRDVRCRARRHLAQRATAPQQRTRKLERSVAQAKPLPTAMLKYRPTEGAEGPTFSSRAKSGRSSTRTFRPRSPLQARDETHFIWRPSNVVSVSPTRNRTICADTAHRIPAAAIRVKTPVGTLTPNDESLPEQLRLRTRKFRPRGATRFHPLRSTRTLGRSPAAG